MGRVVRHKKKQADRITVVSGQLSEGGAERVAIDLCAYLRDTGRTVTLLTLSGKTDTYLPPEGVQRIRLMEGELPSSPLPRAWRLARAVIGVRRRITSQVPDVVVAFVDKVNILVLVSLFGSGIPVVISERVHPAYNPIGWVWKLARKLVYPLARAVTVQTEQGAEWFRQRSRVTHPIVIANAVRNLSDLDISSGCNNAHHEALPPRPFVLAIGRFTDQKGFDLLLEAFHRSDLVKAGWQMVILGDGPEREALEKQARTLGIRDAVRMPGFTDVGPFLRQADLFVLSSRYEGFPNALMEAMQVGLPCISFDCPSGPCDLIRNEQNGWLIPAQDVAALAEALRRMSANPDLRKRLGSEATRVNDQFSPARIYGKWLALLDDVVAHKSFSG